MSLREEKGKIWAATVALLNSNGFTTRGETKAEADQKKSQTYFERNKLVTNPVGHGKRH